MLKWCADELLDVFLCMQTPDMERRLTGLSQLTRTAPLAQNVVLKHLAQRTAVSEWLYSV